MSIQKINPKLAVLVIIMLAAAAIRIPNSAQMTPISNFTPIGAMGLFGGAYFSKSWKAMLFPLLTLLISDLLIQYFVFHGKYGILYGGWYYIYAGFLLISFIGKWMITKVTITRVLSAAIVASLTHWAIADFSVWLGGGIDLRTMQPLSRDWAGLFQTYVQGFPYMKNFLMGTLAYSGIMFGIFEWYSKRETKQANALAQ